MTTGQRNLRGVDHGGRGDKGMVSVDRIPMGRMVFSHGKFTIFDGIFTRSLMGIFMAYVMLVCWRVCFTYLYNLR